MEGWIKGVRVLERVLDAGWWWVVPLVYLRLNPTLIFRNVRILEAMVLI